MAVTVKVVADDDDDGGDAALSEPCGVLRCGHGRSLVHAALDDGIRPHCGGADDRVGSRLVVDVPVLDFEAPIEAELVEGRRILALHLDGLPPESYTCFECVGRRLKSNSTEDELASWADLGRFGGVDAHTLCPLAWDQYNTDGDCLAGK